MLSHNHYTTISIDKILQVESLRNIREWFLIQSIGTIKMLKILHRATLNFYWFNKATCEVQKKLPTGFNSGFEELFPK